MNCKATMHAIKNGQSIFYKLIILLVATSTISLNSFGQAPEGFKYQAVIRDAGNTILNNQAVGMRMTIQQGSIGGTAVYTETFATITNAYGIVNLEIGSGMVVSGDFTTIDWANGLYFIETAVDLNGGTSYSVMGTSQLMSVPYALYAKTAENVTNDAVDDADSDPINEIQTINRTGTTVTLSNGGTFEDSVGVYTAGTGIDIIDNVINTTEPTYTIGLWPALGGYVFWLSTDGKHGLVAETQDQGSASWYLAQNNISFGAYHSLDGQEFRDWRMPTFNELLEMNNLQDSIGGFSPGIYWSSTENNSTDAYTINFDVYGVGIITKNNEYYIRSVRSF